MFIHEVFPILGSFSVIHKDTNLSGVGVLQVSGVIAYHTAFSLPGWEGHRHFHLKIIFMPYDDKVGVRIFVSEREREREREILFLLLFF